MRAIAVICAVVISTAAMAEDFDSRWIGETLGEGRGQVHRGGRAARPRERVVHARRERTEDPRVRVVKYESEPDRAPEPPADEPVKRSSCLPSVGAISHEKLTTEAAWEDAQRAWQNAVRWTYGERFMAIAHAASVTRICNISASAQNATGRIGEVVRDAIGTEAGGNRWRCEITAQPCMAPKETDAAWQR